MMQQPTLQNVRIRSTRDACQIFYAVARNVLPMTTRRLDAEERRAIITGNVYIWEERCANSEATGMGMERWTDGMGWGPSRVRDEFLFYHQRESEVNEDPSHPSARWANMMRRREPRPGSLPFSRSDSERLIKQTYSVHVSLPDDHPRGVTRKWHLTAYFSQTTLDGLGTIDDIPGVGNVPVPEGWFRSARASKAKRTEPNSGDESSTQDPWGLGVQPSAGHGLSQFPLDHIAGPSSYSYAPHGAPHYSTTEQHVINSSAATRYHAAHAMAVVPQLPTLHDSGLQSYRDPSPLNFSTSSTMSSSSSSSDPDYSPHPFSSPLSPPDALTRSGPPSAHIEQAALGSRDLVPLTVLQGLSRPMRNPVDEQFLRRFSTTGVTSSDFARTWSPSGARQTGAGRGDCEGEEMKPRMPISVDW